MCGNLFHGDRDRSAEILPSQRECAFAATQILEHIFQAFDQRGRLFHPHLDPAQILSLVVDGSPLAGLLVDDQNPVGGVGEIDVERVVALGHDQAAQVEFGVGVQLGGRVGSGAPDRVGGIVADLSILAEELTGAAFDGG